jgi:hypothetical protein
MSVCCPTCWTWSKQRKSGVCERCGTPLLLPDGRSAAEVVDAPTQTIEAIPAYTTLPVAAQLEAPSFGAQHTTLTRDAIAGIAGGVGVAIVGAALWAGIAGLTLYRLSLIGLVIGLGMAFVFARFGLRGPAFAIVAAALAVGGCALGDLGAGTLIVSSRAGVSPGAVLTSIPISKLMNVDALDALFYAVAGFAAFRRVARSVPAVPATVAAATAAAPPPPPPGAPPVTRAVTPPETGFGGYQLRSQLPSGPPPAPSTPSLLRRTQMSRRTLGVRIAVPAVAIAVAITVATLGNQGKSHQSTPSPLTGLFEFTSETGDYIGQGLTKQFGPPHDTLTLTPEGGGDSAAATTSGFTVHVSAADAEYWDITVAPPHGQTLHAGTYSFATRAPFQGGDSAGLDVTGDSRGCNASSDSFTVNQMVTNSAGVISAVDVSFTQHCEGQGPALTGRVQITV